MKLIYFYREEKYEWIDQIRMKKRTRDHIKYSSDDYSSII